MFFVMVVVQITWLALASRAKTREQRVEYRFVIYVFVAAICGLGSLLWVVVSAQPDFPLWPFFVLAAIDTVLAVRVYPAFREVTRTHA